MSLKHGLLGLLNYGSMTGYELNKAFNASLNFFWKAQTSQIYRELNVMEKIGWVESNIVIQTNKPNKRVYSITNNGVNELNNWLTTKCENSFRSEFLMRIFFSGELSIESSINMISNYKNENENYLSELEKTNDSINYYGNSITTKKQIYWLLSANFGNQYTKMCIEWAKESLEILSKFNNGENK